MPVLGWGHHGANRGVGGFRGWHLKNQDSLLQSTLEKSRWSIEHCRQLNMTSGQWDPSEYHSWAPDASNWGHLGSVGTWDVRGLPVKNEESITKYSWNSKMVYWTLQTIEHELRSMGPKLVPLLGTRSSTRGYIWPKVSLTQRLTKCQADLM